MTVREPVHKPTSYRQGHISSATTTLGAKCLTDELARPAGDRVYRLSGRVRCYAGQADSVAARGGRAGFAGRRAGSAGGPHAAGRDFLAGDRDGWLADRAP